MRTLYKAAWTLGLFALLNGSAGAISLGTNITVSDENYDGGGTVPGPTAWYGDHEDNEVELNPTSVNQQVWDLEGMFLSGTKLTLVGGYDFKNGLLFSGTLIKGGDLFIDVTGDAKYGQTAIGNSGVTGYGIPQPLHMENIFGYDYVLQIGAFSGEAGSVADASVAFNLIQLTESSIVNRGTDVAASNPWTYDSGGTLLGTGAGSYGLLSTEEAALYGFLGDAASDQHFYLTLDLAGLPGGWNEATFHYTMDCGNDNVMGKVASVPDSASTILLLGVSMFGFVFLRRSLCA